MTYGELEAFLTIVKHKSFSAASSTLFITQPALSRKISYLEKELGYSLFIRSKGVRELHLTPEGRDFIPIANILKTNMEKAKNLPIASKNRFFVVDTTGHPNNYYYIDDMFISAYPEVSFSFSMSSIKEAYAMVENCSVDIAFTTTPFSSDYVDTTLIYSDPMCVISTYPISDSSVIDSKILDATKEIRYSWSPQFDAWHNIHFSWSSHIPPWSKESAHTYETSVYKAYAGKASLLKNYLSIDNIWFLAPTMFYEVIKNQYPNIYCYEVTNKPPDYDLYYIKNKNFNSPYIDSYISFIKVTAKKFKSIKIY